MHKAAWFSLVMAGWLLAGCTAAEYDDYIEKRAAYSREMDRRHDAWFEAIME